MRQEAIWESAGSVALWKSKGVTNRNGAPCPPGAWHGAQAWPTMVAICPDHVGAGEGQLDGGFGQPLPPPLPQATSTHGASQHVSRRITNSSYEATPTWR